jgi:hypothetical protein
MYLVEVHTVYTSPCGLSGGGGEVVDKGKAVKESSLLWGSLMTRTTTTTGGRGSYL